MTFQSQSCGVGQRRSLVVLGCQIGRNRLNLGLTRVAWMVQVINANAAFASAHISRFGSEAIVQSSESAHATDPAAGLTSKPASWVFWGYFGL